MRKKIGIITGSGPEAGVDLWQKVLYENKLYLKDKFQGDLDAPDVTILSVPELGHSMELEKNYDMVWETLKSVVEDICSRVDFFVIACNTLNVYEEKIEELGFKDKFLSTLDVVKDYISENNLNEIALIGAYPVIQMKEYSVFKSLNESFNIEVPKKFDKVQELIYDVKKCGGTNHKTINNFRHIVDSLTSRDIFLACTELPLIKLIYRDKNLIDVSQLLAKKLVQNSFYNS